jgi:predicted house-cleaning noncanonical NTP pyrophosphatase (MazG superfamily)
MALDPAPDGYPIKLVRDYTQRVINPSETPGELWYGPMPFKGTGERQRWLKMKLMEEVGEFLVDGGVSELTDVVAVIQALAPELGATIEDLIVDVRKDERGGFLKGVMMYGRHQEFDGGQS